MRAINVDEFGRVFLIYCLDPLDDGSWIALNRKYKPVGVSNPERVEYDKSAGGRFKFKSTIRDEQIAAIACKRDARTERIYLYDYGSLPTSSAEHWRAYSERLRLLAGLMVELVS